MTTTRAISPDGKTTLVLYSPGVHYWKFDGEEAYLGWDDERVTDLDDAAWYFGKQFIMLHAERHGYRIETTDDISEEDWDDHSL